jgi:hypothetical protein
MECRLTGETEVLGRNLPQRHFCPSENPTWPDPGFNPGRRGGKTATNRLSYGAAIWGPLRLLSNGNCCPFLGVKAHQSLIPNAEIKNDEATPQLPNISSRRYA